MIMHKGQDIHSHSENKAFNNALKDFDTQEEGPPIKACNNDEAIAPAPTFYEVKGEPTHRALPP